MKTHNVHLYLSFLITAALPMPSYAQVQLPNWLNPLWIQAKLMDFHITNTVRIEQVQAHAQAKKNVTTVAKADPIQLKPTLAPVETAKPKMNEKYLSKEELAELRKQLRQKP